MLNKYPASFKQIRSVVNHNAADKKIGLLGKAEKKFVEANKPKLAKRLCEKDADFKLLDGKIEYSEKQRRRL